MTSCPRCGATEFRQGVCARCGTRAPVPVVVGERAPPPPSYDVGGLVLTELAAEEEIATDEERAVSIEGFEGTRLDDSAPVRSERKPEPPPPPPKPDLAFPAAICPSCGLDLPQPTPAFCDGCGTRLPRLRKDAMPASTLDVKTCRQCGFKNASDRAVCTNCGERI